MQTSSVCTVALEVSRPRLKSAKKLVRKQPADHFPKLESPLSGASLKCLINMRRVQCAMQNEKERSLISSGKGEADARNWSSLQERSSPAATCIFRRVTFAFGIFLNREIDTFMSFLKTVQMKDIIIKSAQNINNIHISHTLFKVKMVRYRMIECSRGFHFVA